LEAEPPSGTDHRATARLPRKLAITLLPAVSSLIRARAGKTGSVITLAPRLIAERGWQASGRTSVHEAASAI
jgi:hypothetical protein